MGNRAILIRRRRRVPHDSDPTRHAEPDQHIAAILLNAERFETARAALNLDLILSPLEIEYQAVAVEREA